MTTRSIWLGLTAVGFALGLGLPAGASAVPSPMSKASVGAELIQSVDYKGRHRHYDRDDEHVRAPFTSVDTGGATHVEAPFATVHNDRYGTYVRAPFVNLWIPR